MRSGDEKEGGGDGGWKERNLEREGRGKGVVGEGGCGAKLVGTDQPRLGWTTEFRVPWVSFFFFFCAYFSVSSVLL